MEGFHHPTLSQEGLKYIGRLGLDFWDDTRFSGKHAYVEEFFEGRTITATGFTSEIRSMKHPNIANVLYVYDISDETYLLGDVFFLLKHLG